MTDKPPEVMTAADAAFLEPPPSYEEIMGVYQTSVKTQESQQSDVPPLAYIDIMPRCLHVGNINGKIIPKFDNFSAITEGANQWLRDNPNMRVWKCETVQRKITVGPDGSLNYDLNEMLRHEATFGFQVFIRGLRLWLTKNPTPGSPTPQLGLMNVVPEKMTIEMPTRYRQGRITIAGEEIQKLNPLMSSYNTFEGLDDTITRLNKRLADDPIQGSILTIETDTEKAYEGFSKQLDPESTVWSVDKDKWRRNTQVIRIFYTKGSPAREEICLKKFVPEVTVLPDALKPAKFEPFSAQIQELSNWTKTNQGVRVVNIQQYDAAVQRTYDGVSVATDSTDDSESAMRERHLLRTLRMFYVKSPSQAAPKSTNDVTCRLFLPARTGRKSFESMNRTMDRIDAWLRVTGAPIYTVETVTMLFAETRPEGSETQQSEYTLRGMTGTQWLTGIRVFFASTFQEPDPSLLPPLPIGNDGKSSSSCEIL